MSEKDVYNVAKTYFPEGHQITADKLNYWMGQEGYWPTVKRKRVDGERKSGRLMNLVKEEYRGNNETDVLLVNTITSLNIFNDRLHFK